MTDFFQFDEPDGPFASPLSDFDTRSVVGDGESAVVRAPAAILVASYCALLVSLACFIPESRKANIVGYLVSGILIALFVILFRSVDRRRRLSTRYVFMTNARILASTPLLLGVIVAAGHAYFIAQTKSLA